MRHVDEGAVGEHRGVERGVEVVGVGHDVPRYCSISSGCVLHRLRERAEDDAGRRQPLLEGGGDRDAVEHRVDRDAGQARALVQRHAELVVGREQLRVDVGQALRPVGLGLGRRVVGDRLVVDRRVAQRAPSAARCMRAPVAQRASAASRAGTAARASCARSAAPRPRPGPAAPCRTRCR